MPIARMAWLFAAPRLPADRAAAHDTPAATHVYFRSISPQEGARVKGAFLCGFGRRNRRVARNDSPGRAHHHPLVDVDEPIALNKRHVHFGEGEIEAMIDSPGDRHTLALVRETPGTTRSSRRSHLRSSPSASWKMNDGAAFVRRT